MLCSNASFTMGNIFVFCVLLILCVSVTKNEEVNEVGTQTGGNEIGTQTELGANGPKVCEICSCNDNIVDCSDREIRKFFEEFDLSEIKEIDKLELDLSGNPIIVIPRIPELKLQKLNLSRCEIGAIEEGAFKNLIRTLGTLDLSKNQLSNTAISKNIFEGSFDLDKGRLIFMNMKNLSLAYNDIHALSKDIFNFMTELRDLDLSGNPLTFIDQVTMAALSELKLKELKLSSCELESLPEGLLRRQRRLEKLDLSDNRLTTIPVVLSETITLRYLNLDKNSLTTLEKGNGLSTLTKLRELRICKNSKLTSIGAEALGGLEDLVSLHITNNPRLISIDPGFLRWEDDQGVERWPELEELRLNNNNITAIDSHFLDSWNQLTSVDFSNNPYVCNCTNQWMVEVLVPLITKMTVNDSTTNMFCKKPADMRGRSFEDLFVNNKTLACPESMEAPPDGAGTPDMAILLGVMIGIFVAFPLVLLVVLLWKNGFFARCRKKYQSEAVPSDDENDAF